MRLDMTITLGNIISGMMCIGAVLGAYLKLTDRLARMETKLDPLWREFERRRVSRG